MLNTRSSVLHICLKGLDNMSDSQPISSLNAVDRKITTRVFSKVDPCVVTSKPGTAQGTDDTEPLGRVLEDDESTSTVAALCRCLYPPDATFTVLIDSNTVYGVQMVGTGRSLTPTPTNDSLQRQSSTRVVFDAVVSKNNASA